MGFTLEFDLTPEQAAAFLALVDRRTYKCKEGRCNCGRKLFIERQPDGFHFTLVDPEFEAYQQMTSAELAEWIDGEGEDFIGDGGNEGTIDLTDAQLADLRKWALGEVAA